MQDKTQEEKKRDLTSRRVYNFIMGFMLGLLAGVLFVLLCAAVEKFTDVEPNTYAHPWVVMATGMFGGLIIGLFADIAFGIGLSLTFGPFLAMHYGAIPMQERLTFSFFMICCFVGGACLAALIKSFFKTKQSKAS